MGTNPPAWTVVAIARPILSSVESPSLALSPRVVSDGVFATGVEGNVWFYSFGLGWTWKSGVVR